MSTLRSRVAARDLGAMPAVLGIAAIALLFQLANSNFLSARNLTNLSLQIAAMATVSCGVVLVLLMKEIDLSAGAVSGLCAALMVVSGVSGPFAVLLAIGAGAVVGATQGLWITRFGVPSFVVTLAGLLGWQGAQLAVLGSAGSYNLIDPFVISLCATFLPAWLAGALGLLGTFFFARGAGRVWLLIPVALATVAWSFDRGAPLAAVIVLGTVAAVDGVVRRTRYGRHLLAVGGNAEAARRAGINVRAVQVITFALASALAALGGVLAASRLLAVNQSSGGGDLLLNSIAAAVIGGTSLFGGRGSAWSAVVGSIAIGSISNGMDLVGMASPAKYMVTGGVLLFAVSVDAVARARRASAVGR